MIVTDITEAFAFFNGTVGFSSSFPGVDGFAGAAFAEFTNFSGYFLTCGASLSCVRSTWDDYYGADLVEIDGLGYGSFADLYFPIDYELSDHDIDTFQCWAQNACPFSHFAFNDVPDRSSLRLGCFGSTSCAHTTTTFSSSDTANNNESKAIQLQGTGLLSFYNADITTPGVNTVIDITLSGTLAGYNTKINCTDGDTCLIKCESTLACFNTTLICSDNANCTVSYCDQTQGLFCPSFDGS